MRTPWFTASRLRPALAVAVVCAWASLGGPAAAAPPERSIRVVLEMVDVDSAKFLNQTAQLACWSEHGVFGDEALAKVQPLPAALQKRFVTTQQELLFDGPRQAEYTVHQQLWVPPGSRDCKPVLYRSYSAQVSNGCELEVTGTSDAPDPAGGPVEAPSVQQERGAPGRTPTCPRKGEAREPVSSYAGLPVDQIKGLPCVWMGDIVRRAAGQAVRALPRGQRVGDSCLWAEEPYYRGESGRLVMVAHADHATAAQRAELTDPVNGSPVAYVELLPVRLEQGPVPAQRFSVDAVRRFVHQPAQHPLSTASQ